MKYTRMKKQSFDKSYEGLNNTFTVGLFYLLNQ